MSNHSVYKEAVFFKVRLSRDTETPFIPSLTSIEVLAPPQPHRDDDLPGLPGHVLHRLAHCVEGFGEAVVVDADGGGAARVAAAVAGGRLGGDPVSVVAKGFNWEGGRTMENVHLIVQYDADISSIKYT